MSHRATFSAAGRSSASSSRAEVATARAMIGNEVLDQAGAAYGYLQGVMVDDNPSHVGFAIICRERPNGQTEQVIAPWSGLRWLQERFVFILDVEPTLFLSGLKGDKLTWKSDAAQADAANHLLSANMIR